MSAIAQYSDGTSERPAFSVAALNAMRVALRSSPCAVNQSDRGIFVLFPSKNGAVCSSS